MRIFASSTFVRKAAVVLAYGKQSLRLPGQSATFPNRNAAHFHVAARVEPDTEKAPKTAQTFYSKVQGKSLRRGISAQPHEIAEHEELDFSPHSAPILQSLYLETNDNTREVLHKILDQEYHFSSFNLRETFGQRRLES